MIGLMLERMAASDAPPEQYERLGLPPPAAATPELIRAACVTETERGELTRVANGGKPARPGCDAIPTPTPTVTPHAQPPRRGVFRR